MITQFDSVIARLDRVPGVLGVMLVGLDDGMVIAGDAGPDRDPDTAAALAASLYRRTRSAAADAGLGDAGFIRLEAERAQMCAMARSDVVVVAMVSNRINLGRLRLEMKGALETL